MGVSWKGENFKGENVVAQCTVHEEYGICHIISHEKMAQLIEL